MITNVKRLKVLLFIMIMCVSCSYFINNKSVKYMKDIFNRPLLGPKVGDCMNFYRENGERICVSSDDIEFIYGADSLLSYIAGYYSDPRNNFKEYNRMELFVVLFDENLNIVEVRNTQLPNQDIEAEYFKIINEKIKNTQGLWREKASRKWYYYPILYKLY